MWFGINFGDALVATSMGQACGDWEVRTKPPRLPTRVSFLITNFSIAGHNYPSFHLAG